MNREAEFASKSLPDRLRSITNESLWGYEADAIEAAAAVLEETYRAVADLQSMTAAFIQASQMLADAPHDTANGCRFGWHKTLPDLSMGDALPCTCWKAGL